MDLKLDLTKAVKIVIEKDEKHQIEYVIDNGEIKDVNIIEIDNSPAKSSDKLSNLDGMEEDIKVTLSDRYFIDKGESLASKIVNARNTVSKVKDAISDTSNPDALHEILDDGTTNEAPKPKSTVSEKYNSFKNRAELLGRSQKLMELVKDGTIDELAKGKMTNPSLYDEIRQMNE